MSSAHGRVEESRGRMVELKVGYWQPWPIIPNFCTVSFETLVNSLVNSIHIDICLPFWELSDTLKVHRLMDSVLRPGSGLCYSKFMVCGLAAPAVQVNSYESRTSHPNQTSCIRICILQDPLVIGK